MAMVTHNGQTIGIADYVSLIIEAARKIIEREQREKGNLDKSGISLISADAPEDKLTNSESETPKEMENTTPNPSGKLTIAVRSIVKKFNGSINLRVQFKFCKLNR